VLLHLRGKKVDIKLLLLEELEKVFAEGKHVGGLLAAGSLSKLDLVVRRLQLLPQLALAHLAPPHVGKRLRRRGGGYGRRARMRRGR
jgi:hypothetical protein